MIVRLNGKDTQKKETACTPTNANDSNSVFADVTKQHRVKLNKIPVVKKGGAVYLIEIEI